MKSTGGLGGWGAGALEPAKQQSFYSVSRGAGQVVVLIDDSQIWNSSLGLSFPGPAASTKAWLVVVVCPRVCNSCSRSDVTFSSTAFQPIVDVS